MAAIAGKLNLVCEKGTTFDRTIVWYTDTAQQVLKNLTGFTAKLEVRQAPGSTVLLTLVSPTGIVLGGTLGTVQLLINVAGTNALAVGLYQYDLVLTSAAGVATRLVEGTFEVRDKITA